MKNALQSKKTCKFACSPKVSTCKIMLNSYLLAFAQLNDPQLQATAVVLPLSASLMSFLFLERVRSTGFRILAELHRLDGRLGGMDQDCRQDSDFLFFTRPFLFFVWCGPCGLSRSFPRWNYRSGSRQALPGDQIGSTSSLDALDRLLHTVRLNESFGDFGHVSLLSSRLVLPATGLILQIWINGMMLGRIRSLDRRTMPSPQGRKETLHAVRDVSGNPVDGTHLKFYGSRAPLRRHHARQNGKQPERDYFTGLTFPCCSP